MDAANAKFVCGAECGLATLGTTSAGTEHWAQINGTPTVVTSGPATMRSTRCFRFNPTASQTRLAHLFASSIGSPATTVARFYLYFASLPNADCGIFGDDSSSGLWWHNSSGTLRGSNASTFAASGFTPSTGVWYQIDLKVVRNTTLTVDFAVDDVAQTQYSVASAAAANASVQIGAFQTTATCDLYIDDIIVSGTSSEYPIGEGTVVGLYPSGDVTNTQANPTDGNAGHFFSATTDFGKGASGATATGAQNAEATSWQSLQNPLSTTIGANWIADLLGANTERLVWTLDNMPVGAGTINGVMGVITTHSASATTNDMQAGVIKAGVTPISGAALIVGPIDLSETTITAPCKILTVAPGVAGATWTAQLVNTADAVFGFSGDVNPDPYLDGICLEVDYVPSSAFDLPSSRLRRPPGRGVPGALASPWFGTDSELANPNATVTPAAVAVLLVSTTDQSEDASEDAAAVVVALIDTSGQTEGANEQDAGLALTVTVGTQSEDVTEDAAAVVLAANTFAGGSASEDDGGLAISGVVIGDTTENASEDAAAVAVQAVIGQAAMGATETPDVPMIQVTVGQIDAGAAGAPAAVVPTVVIGDTSEDVSEDAVAVALAANTFAGGSAGEDDGGLAISGVVIGAQTEGAGEDAVAVVAQAVLGQAELSASEDAAAVALTVITAGDGGTGEDATAVTAGVTIGTAALSASEDAAAVAVALVSSSDQAEDVTETPDVVAPVQVVIGDALAEDAGGGSATADAATVVVAVVSTSDQSEGAGEDGTAVASSTVLGTAALGASEDASAVPITTATVDPGGSVSDDGVAVTAGVFLGQAALSASEDSTAVVVAVGSTSDQLEDVSEDAVAVVAAVVSTSDQAEDAGEDAAAVALATGAGVFIGTQSEDVTEDAAAVALAVSTYGGGGISHEPTVTSAGVFLGAQSEDVTEDAAAVAVASVSTSDQNEDVTETPDVPAVQVIVPQPSVGGSSQAGPQAVIVALVGTSDQSEDVTETPDVVASPGTAMPPPGGNAGEDCAAVPLQVVIGQATASAGQDDTGLPGAVVVAVVSTSGQSEGAGEDAVAVGSSTAVAPPGGGGGSTPGVPAAQVVSTSGQSEGAGEDADAVVASSTTGQPAGGASESAVAVAVGTTAPPPGGNASEDAEAVLVAVQVPTPTAEEQTGASFPGAVAAQVVIGDQDEDAGAAPGPVVVVVNIGLPRTGRRLRGGRVEPGPGHGPGGRTGTPRTRGGRVEPGPGRGKGGRVGFR